MATSEHHAKTTIMKALVMLAALVGVLVSGGNAFALGGLQSQTVNGFSRYCKYSDGGVLTVGSTDLCPATNQSVPNGNDSPNIDIQNRNRGFSSLTRQVVNDLNRYCFYSDKAVLTVKAMNLCPVTNQ